MPVQYKASLNLVAIITAIQMFETNPCPTGYPKYTRIVARGAKGILNSKTILVSHEDPLPCKRIILMI